MLGWLKRRYARGSYINTLRRHIPSDMFVSETVQCILSNVKLVVVNSEGRDYSLEVPLDMTIEHVKEMAVGHFFSPQEVVGGEERYAGNGSKAGGGPNRTYRLVLVRESRQLIDTNSVQLEQLLDNDELLLQERRQPPTTATQDVQPWTQSMTTTQKQIQTATAHLPERSRTRPSHLNHQPVDFQIEFRRILITMIVASIRLISADPESEAIIRQILEKLERRHRPQVDRVALKQLTDMGFPEASATKALQINRNVREAAEWLLEQNNEECYLESVGGGEEANQSSSTHGSNSATIQDEKDPTERILQQFLEYRKKWFQPNPQALQQLEQMGFSEEMAIDALRACGNKLQVASNLLASGGPIQDTEGLDRDSPIISAIFASPVIQLALPKPKTLLALMMLYESPNNANMWLSDPDTHPIVSQVIRIYHAEKHSLGRSSSSQATLATTEDQTQDHSIVPDQTQDRSTMDQNATRLDFLDHIRTRSQDQQNTTHDQRDTTGMDAVQATVLNLDTSARIVNTTALNDLSNATALGQASSPAFGHRLPNDTGDMESFLELSQPSEPNVPQVNPDHCPPSTIMVRNGNEIGMGQQQATVSTGSPSVVLASASHAVHHFAPAPSPSHPPPQVHNTMLSSAPAPVPAAVSSTGIRMNSDEPMSHSGSPIRRAQEPSYNNQMFSLLTSISQAPPATVDTSCPNSTTVGLMSSLGHGSTNTVGTPTSLTQLPGTQSDSHDVEMDESNTNSQAMDIQ